MLQTEVYMPLSDFEGSVVYASGARRSLFAAIAVRDRLRTLSSDSGRILLKGSCRSWYVGTTCVTPAIAVCRRYCSQALLTGVAVNLKRLVKLRTVVPDREGTGTARAELARTE
jgi:hypothetical protein